MVWISWMSDLHRPAQPIWFIDWCLLIRVEASNRFWSPYFWLTPTNMYICMIYKISRWSYIDVKISKMKAYLSMYKLFKYIFSFINTNTIINMIDLFSHIAHVPLTLQPASFTTLSSSTKVCYTVLQAREGWNCYGWWFRNPAHQLVRGHITLIEVSYPGYYPLLPKYPKTSK